MNAEEKTRILGKFVEILSTNGIESTFTRQLYGAAGVGSTVVYDEWGSKENMVMAAGEYITEVIVNELRCELLNYADNNVAMGEYFFRIFQKYKKEMRFCIQLMSSPNPKYSVSNHCARGKFLAWSDELAEIFGVEKKEFRGNFMTFLATMYFYCMTEDEEVSRIQRFHIYESFKKIPKATLKED